MEIRCSDCKSWKETPEPWGTPDRKFVGECRLHAPVAHEAGPCARPWPRTKPDDWCGEFCQSVESAQRNAGAARKEEER
jgi:hypothetical protein